MDHVVVQITGTASIPLPDPVPGPPGPKGDQGDPGRDGVDGVFAETVSADTGAFDIARFGAIADSKTDNRHAIQAAYDAAANSPLGGVVRVPTSSGTRGVAGPVYLDGENVSIVGDGHSSRIAGAAYYGGPILAAGVRRLEKAGLNPADFRKITGSLDASATGRSSLVTNGTAGLLISAHPAQLGAPISGNNAELDYWQADSYTIEAFVERGSSPIIGMVLGNWGSDEPAPWGIWFDETNNIIQFAYKLEGDSFRRWHASNASMGKGPWRICVQFDSVTGTVNLWVNDALGPTSLALPGKRLFKPKSVDPCSFGMTHGYFDGAVQDIIISGSRFTKGLLYKPGVSPQLRIDGTNVNDLSRYFNSVQQNINSSTNAYDIQTFFYFPLTDSPATHVQAKSVGFDGVGFWVPKVYPQSGKHTLIGLNLETGLQSSLAIGPMFDLIVRDCEFHGGTQGIGSLQLACAYFLDFDGVDVYGSDCGAFFHQVIASARNFKFALSGRNALRFNGGGFDGSGLRCTFTSDAIEVFFLFCSQAYGNTHRIDAVIDNENGNPNLTAIIEIESAPFCVNRLEIQRLDIGGLNNLKATVLHLIGNGLGGIYGRSHVSAKNLSVFGKTGIGLQADGVGWFGDFDGSGLTPFEANGDVQFITVTQPLPLISTEAGFVVPQAIQVTQ